VYEYLPTAAGLALIPFIVKPLDSLVEKVTSHHMYLYFIMQCLLCSQLTQSWRRGLTASDKSYCCVAVYTAETVRSRATQQRSMFVCLLQMQMATA
jgi:hypothetical protein